MIGTQIHILELWSIWPFILGGFAIVTLARAAACYPTLLLLNISGERLPAKWHHVINWGGIHGSIPVALALGLPEIPERTFIVNMVFGIVFLSLTIQGLTVSPLVRLLGLGGRVEEEEQYERAIARTVVIRRGLEELTSKLNTGRISEKIHERVAGELEEELGVIQTRIEELEAHPDVQRSWENRTRQGTLTLQKSALYEMMIQGDLSHEAAEELMGEVDERLERLESEEEEY